MSDIPFVNRLGDAMESAVAAKVGRRRRFPRGPRRAGLAVALVAVAAAGVAIAQIAGDPQELAANQIGCYETADLSGDIAVVAPDGRPPTAICADARRADGRSVPPLVACARGAAIVVLPGRDCRSRGLDRLPAGHDLAREKVADLARAVAAVEEGADCIPHRDLARQAQGLLDRLGWQGWRAVVGGKGMDAGPCGWIRQLGGAGPSLTGALRTDRGELVVTTGPPRLLYELLLGPGSAGERLVERSGERCFTIAELREQARDELAAAGKSIRFKLGQLSKNTGIEPPRGDRYAEGCAIATGAYPAYPASGAVEIEVEILQQQRQAARSP